MFIPSWTTLLHAAQQDVGRRTSSSNVCLPNQLQSTVPACSISCIQEFIVNNYSNLACSATGSLNFLCVTKTSSGLTIGEGSLQCVISDCPGADLEVQSGFTVCDGILGAVPNTAKTITATVDSVTVLQSATQSARSSTATQSSPNHSTSSHGSKTSSTVLQSSASSNPNTTPSPQLTSTLPSTSSLATVPPLTNSNMPTATALSSSTSITSMDATESTASTTPAIAPSTGMTTAMPATDAPRRQELSTGAIAGIAAGSAVVLALIVAYLAYLCMVKRKKKQRRSSQRSSALFPPATDNDNAGSSPQALFKNSPGTTLSSPVKGYDTGEQMQQQKRKSFWRRSVLAPSDIGVAVAASTRVSPKQSTEALNSKPQIPWPSPALTKDRRSFQSPRAQSRWSVATSINEDIEAQNQDVPILGSPRARLSARPLSSVGAIEKPAPLRLSKVKPRAETPPSARIPLTPVYDNGTFEPVTRQVLEDPLDLRPGVAGQRPQTQRSTALNFSRREPSLTRTSREQSLPAPWSAQMLQQDTSTQFPVKAPPPGRKQSQISNWSVSVYTDIEEDETPEQESEKQFGEPQPNPAAAGTARPPLKDLQWPQIPRSAEISKQAERTQSPRAAMTLQQVGASSDITSDAAQPAMDTPDQMVSRGRSFLRTDTSSSSEILSIASASPVFPLPPVTHRRTNAQTQVTLARQISDAYKAATRLTTTTTTPTPTTASRYSNRSFAPVGQMYQQIQRLSRGRPLAPRLSGQGYSPHPSISRQPTNRTPRSGDLYFTVPMSGMYG